jgi:tRNA(His) 5'-end guanylyltransferase
MQALLLMNECAKAVLEDISDVVFCYGVSDEYRSLHLSDVWVLQYLEFGVCVCVCVCVCFYSLLKTLAQIICLMPFHLCSFASCGIVESNLSWTVQCVVTV